MLFLLGPDHRDSGPMSLTMSLRCIQSFRGIKLGCRSVKRREHPRREPGKPRLEGNKPGCVYLLLWRLFSLHPSRGLPRMRDRPLERLLSSDSQWRTPDSRRYQAPRCRAGARPVSWGRRCSAAFNPALAHILLSPLHLDVARITIRPGEPIPETSGSSRVYAELASACRGPAGTQPSAGFRRGGTS